MAEAIELLNFVQMETISSLTKGMTVKYLRNLLSLYTKQVFR